MTEAGRVGPKGVLNVAVALLALAVAALPGWANPVIDPLDRADKRVVQAALAISGDYDGLLDGAWGPRSERAFTGFAQREGAGPPGTYPAAVIGEVLGTLIGGYVREWEGNGWRVLHDPETPIGFALPDGMMTETRDSAGREWRSADGGFAMRLSRDTAAETARRHGAARAAHTGPEPAYRFERADRMITASAPAPDRRSYLRSEAVPGGYRSLWIDATEPNWGRLAMVAASVSPARQPPLDPPRSGPLHALMQAAAMPGPAPDPLAPEPLAPDPPAQRAPADERSAGPVGTGFFFNRNELVAMTGLFAGCAALRLVDGTPLAPGGALAGGDFLVLRADAGAAAVVPMARPGQMRLGSEVVAVGFVSGGGAGLSVRNGTVSAVSGGSISIGDSEVLSVAPPPAGSFAVSLDPGPVGQGWAILDLSGALGGIMLDPAEADGAEQNGNGVVFARTIAALRDDLSGAGVGFLDAAPGRAPLSRAALVATLTGAVVALHCAP